MAVFRPRRPHSKSRHGCLECKRRKVKCDELKPSCSRCGLMFQRCCYPAAIQWSTDRTHTVLPSTTVFSPLSEASFLSSRSSPSPPRRPPSALPTPTSVLKINRPPSSSESSTRSGTSDLDMWRHYLEHTSQTLSPCPKARAIHQLRMPALALHNTAVFNSILAISAICMCHDRMTAPLQSQATPEAVHEILMAGYLRHNFASEEMRKMLGRGERAEQEALLVTQLLVVPFAAASQQVNHWLSTMDLPRRSEGEQQKRLESSPRNIVVIMRGIKTTIESVAASGEAKSMQGREVNVVKLPSLSRSMERVRSRQTTSPPGAAADHPLLTLVAKTSSQALQDLSARLQKLLSRPLNTNTEDLAICFQALNILKQIHAGIFSKDHPPIPFDLSRPGVPHSSHHLPPWLHSYLNWQRGALTRPLLSFLVQVPQKYLDLILPLLDQRLETPLRETFGPSSLHHLSYTQALALDIYAHWSVLMILVERESWWIGSLPVVTSEGMVNRYGEDPVAREFVYRIGGAEDWWPGTVLKVAKQTR